MPDTGSLRERITTSTRCALSSLNASSFLTSEYAMPGLAATSSLSSCNFMYACGSPDSNSAFSSSKLNSAREEIATTNLSSSVTAIFKTPRCGRPAGDGDMAQSWRGPPWIRLCRATGGAPSRGRRRRRFGGGSFLARELVELDDRQQHREHDQHHDEAHRHDQC